MVIAVMDYGETDNFINNNNNDDVDSDDVTNYNDEYITYRKYNFSYFDVK